MRRTLSFFMAAVLWIGALSWWARSQSSGGVDSGAWTRQKSAQVLRLELLELLDRVVTYQGYYRTVYGQFTRSLARAGVWVPRAVQDTYDIRVVEAGPDRFLVTAASEHQGKTVDLVSVDQDFRLRSTFPLPMARPDYLKVHAFKHLRAMRHAREPSKVVEKGLFSGYFQYSIQDESDGRRSARAMGIRPPVVGLALELGSHNDDSDGLGDEPAPSASVLHHARKMDASSFEPMTTVEEAYLAQRIFRGEMGRYAQTWDELRMLADFAFEDSAQMAPDEVLQGESVASREFDGRAESIPRVPASIGLGPLEVEPVENDF